MKKHTVFARRSYKPVFIGVGEFVAFLVVSLLLSNGITRLGGIDQKSSTYVVLAFFSVIFVTGLYIACVRLLEHRGVDELRPEAAWEFVPGFVLGLLMFSAVIGMLVALGAYKVGAGSGASTLFYGLGISLIGAAIEELTFRGILLRQFEKSFGSIGALIVTALVFGILHIPNQNATILSGLVISAEAGLLLGAAYLVTRCLWLPIGLHAARNFAEGGIFGVRVSGQTIQGLFKSTPVPGDVLSGGAFGVEGSIVSVVVCVAVALALLMMAVKRGNLRSPDRLRQAA